MKKAEAIIFDLGGVILNIDYNLTRKAFENAGIKNFDEMYSQSNADDLFSKLETGKIDEVDFYKEINKRTGLGLPSAEIKKAWNAMLLTFREKSLEFLDSLKPKYKLYLLSNTNHIHLKEFNTIFLVNERKKSFKDFFDTIYYSCEIGLRKPDVECFEWVLNENNLVAEKTIFIDDSAQNIEGAKIAGMQTILLEPGRYIEDLEL
jgi:epoxide hydrolase-like predicted phosphatase